MRILIFDNYDSFTWNLVHIVHKLGYDNYDVFRNDKISLRDIGRYDKILLSPGPGIPSESGLLLPLIREYASSRSILGVCLGHQAIGEVFGATLVNIRKVMHGVATPANLTANGEGLFAGIPGRVQVGRYHSWIVDRQGFPDCLKITAVDDEDSIMALAHKEFDVQGVQFHPESVLTEHGERMLKNWLES